MELSNIKSFSMDRTFYGNESNCCIEGFETKVFLETVVLAFELFKNKY